MNPGLVVKLRPSGPWRIGPDSGARNRVDVIYHSDSLYSAVTAAMLRLGWLEEWLDATARTSEPAVSLSSCFPFVGDIIFVVPPRTVWPPASPSAKAARVRWKSARFVPLPVVQSILAGEQPDENQWSVDGPSDCLVPAGKPGPFRTSVRSNACVDRLTGTSERHSTACIEFRADSGWWTVVSFATEAAEEQWSAKVKAAFRLLADTGFGGERSRGWGRSEAPEFADCTLPDLILPLRTESAEAAVVAAPEIAPLVVESEAPQQETAPIPAPEQAPPEAAPAEAGVEPATASAEPESLPAAEPGQAPSDPAPAEPEPTSPEAVAEAEPPGPSPGPESLPAAESGQAPSDPAPVEPEPTSQEAAIEAEPSAASEEPESLPAVEPGQAPSDSAPAEPEPASQEAATEVEPTAASEEPESPPAAEPEVPAAEAGPETPAVEPPPAAEPEPATVEPSPKPSTQPEPSPATPAPTHPHWLLSLFTPAPADSVDWRRGNYTVLPRGGRIDSPAGSGELKKEIPMVAEGSVLYAEAPPRGSAADVAPDGFAHPVFRAGFAVAIPLPEVR